MRFYGDIPFKEKEFCELLARGEVVKRNPVREVIRAGNYFIKHDKRGVRALKAEYENGLFLSKRNIPVVRYCGYIDDVDGGYLVSEAVQNAVPVASIAEAGGCDADFLRDFVAFVNLLREKRLCHDDLIAGNILFTPESRRFVLIDVRSVRHGLFSFYRERIFSDLVMELRTHLSRKIIFETLRAIGVSAPEKVWRRRILEEFRHTVKTWQKRRRQILSGYPRFTRPEGHFLFDRRADAGEIVSARRFPAKFSVFGAIYFLSLIHIPAERVVGYDLSCKDLLLPPERLFEAPDPEAVADYVDRLALCGIFTREEDWRKDETGRIVLVNFDPVAEKLW